MALKQKASNRPGGQNDPSKPPPTYQKGVLPKYLKNRKGESIDEPEPDCPPGHVLLPEEERKETLRVLRQSEWSLVQKFIIFVLIQFC